ncbi:GNAT family N-acetyltransferase [Sphingomonas sp. CFBP 13706]|uniref:GNAT family N-acetyltransferase n=1 Tax=Sphingomonas sp. CFBP 13706 TaxID=2775314 RepID=UPI0017809C3D|nr:GNAT family N-acetyltransferase [Sphingomonas sp. CFBP 13706]
MVLSLTRADRPTTISLTFTLQRDRAGLVNLEGEINLENQRCDVGVSGLGGHQDTVFVVARRDGVPVGCGTLSLFLQHDVELLKLFVSRSERRSRLATRLIDHAVDEARRCGVDTLHVQMAGSSRAFWRSFVEGREGQVIPPDNLEFDIRVWTESAPFRWDTPAGK